MTSKETIKKELIFLSDDYTTVELVSGENSSRFQFDFRGEIFHNGDERFCVTNEFAYFCFKLDDVANVVDKYIFLE